jgi:hypothetical protein
MDHVEEIKDFVPNSYIYVIKLIFYYPIITNNNTSVALVLERTIQTERPLVGEVSANFCG